MLKRFSAPLVIMIWLFASCNDPEAFDCFKTIGELVEYDIPAETFDRVEIHDGMDVFLKNGPERKISIKGGKNLLPKVRVTFLENTLKIDNENRCNWTREYDKIQVYITSPEINEIWHYGFGNIVSLDTLRSDNLKVVGQWCSGDINLIVDTPNLYYVSNGVSIVTLSGIANHLQAGHYYNDGIFNGEQLNTNTVWVDHKGYSRILVKVSTELSGQILQNGTLEYITDNPDLKVEVLGKGRLIKIGS